MEKIDVILWYLLGFITFASWYLYVFETLSKIRRRRNIYLRDWGFSAFQPMKNLKEYRDICEQENESLKWYKAQVYLSYSFIGVVMVSIFLVSVMH